MSRVGERLLQMKEEDSKYHVEQGKRCKVEQKKFKPTKLTQRKFQKDEDREAW